jgi:hypothetical protein
MWGRTSNTFLQQKNFFCYENDPLICFIHLIMQEYDSKCLKMYLITLKVFKICYKMFAPITKVNEGESNTPCPSTLEVTYSLGWKIILSLCVSPIILEKCLKCSVFSTPVYERAPLPVFPDVMVLPCDFTAVCHDSKTNKSTRQSFFNFQENTFQILMSKPRFD